MERKTTIQAENGKQDLLITREFDLPVERLFKAYQEPELVAQWMGTKVLKLENKQHGGWQFETTDAQNKVVFRAHGVIHEFMPNRKITRTFQMENPLTSAQRFEVQLEFLEFEPLTLTTSRLTIHTVYRSVASRDLMLQLPFAKGLTMAHNRLQTIMNQVN
ncbi:SRPBCC domain-containing protein [Spirosoma pollinicola]|uniref:ATPase n=1 Tax=Spirosoma pollinicola TaxID=2057025 RepID=A0A2K8Z0X9_9BACT|nr:SRPBCC domain-containing protein [Spirosoma pollinicola]AUD03478.1 ATPase [Spirosoma pollinicola]